MTQPAVDARAKLYLYAAANTSPEDDHDDMEEALKTYVKEEDAQIKEDLQLGLASFERAKPQAQLDAFIASTLPQDLPFILTDGWYEARISQLAQPLTAEKLYWQEITRVQMATQVAAITGGPPPPPAQPRPYWFWPQVIMCRAMVFKTLQSRFRSLIHEEERKQGAQASGGGGSAGPQPSPVAPSQGAY